MIARVAFCALNVVVFQSPPISVGSGAKRVEMIEDDLHLQPAMCARAVCVEMDRDRAKFPAGCSMSAISARR